MIKKKRTDLWGPMTDEAAEEVMAAMIPVIEDEIVFEEIEAKPKKKKAQVEEPAPTFLSDIKDL